MTGEMAQQVRALKVKPDDLSLGPKNDRVEEEDGPCKLSRAPHIFLGLPMCMCTHQINK